MNKSTILMSPADSKIYNFFEKQFNVISSDCLEDFISFEQYHADMQALKINDNLFVNKNCINLLCSLESHKINYTLCSDIGNIYPYNVTLNAALVGNKLLCNQKALDPLVKEYCDKSDIIILNVKQGYAKCSTLVIDENSLITDDESIQKASKKAGLNVLLIEKGDIYLDDNNYGFIGGASCKIGDTVYFFGDINTHRNSEAIKNFILNKNLKIRCITKEQLTDIGGIIILD